MKVGDRVRFRVGTKAGIFNGVEPEARGTVVEVYSNAQAKGAYKVDVSFAGSKEINRAIDVAELDIVRRGHGVPSKQHSARRFHLLTGFATLGLLVTGVLTLHAAKAAQREKRLVERVQPVCARNGLTNREMRRLVRFAYKSWPNREDAVRATVTLCRGNA